MISQIFAIAAAKKAAINYVFNGLIRYDVPNNAIRSSAGVYSATDDTLVRTLWGNKSEISSTSPTFQWDGLDDYGNAVTLGNYYVKVKTNAVNYNYDGVVGNSSNDLYGEYRHRGNDMSDLCFVGTKAFYGVTYSEHGTALKAFSTDSIQKLISSPLYATTISTSAVCTDGNIVYWAGWSSNDAPEQLNYYVIGTYASNNANALETVPFASNVAINNFNGGNGRVAYSNILSVTLNDSNAGIASMCAQKSGNLLFVARPGLNQLQVVDKSITSGLTIKTITDYSTPVSIACDDNGNLYMITNGVLKKFSVAQDGTLTLLSVVFNDLINPTHVEVSPDGFTIAVSDSATNQVKFYSANGGNRTGILGTGISYRTNPYAADDKFASISFVKYQPDGCLWVADPENRRYQRFNADLTYKDNIAFIPNSRSAAIDMNNAARIFSNYIEYERDYSKPLAGNNGSWKFKANWQGDYAGGEYSGLRVVYTLSNNRTYGLLCYGNAEVELTVTGLRETGYYPNTNYNYSMAGRDGTHFFPVNYNNDYMLVYKQAITDFTAEGNPIRGPKTPFVQTPPNTSNNYNPSTGYEGGFGHTNDSDRYIFFSNLFPDDDSQMSYHLGAFKPGASKFLWKTSQSTRRSYSGNYPTNGDYDIGNGNQHSENCHTLIYDHDIFWNVNGEGWKESEINIWNHFSDDGLLVGHFGTQAVNFDSAFAAGNAFGTGLSKNGNNYQIVWCDESVKAGVGCCTVSGLDTITDQILPFKISKQINVPFDPSDLMLGLPYNSNFTGGNGWIVDQPTSGLIMPTNRFLYRRGDSDIRIAGETGTRIVRRSLNNDLALNSWSVNGGMMMNGGYATDHYGNNNFLEILDSSNRIIMQFKAFVNDHDGYSCYFSVNGVVLAQGDVWNLFYPLLWNDYNNFSFSFSANALTFQYADFKQITINSAFDSNAEKTKPGYLRVYQSAGIKMATDLTKLRFTKS